MPSRIYLLLGVVLSLTSFRAFSYPEMIRHGYTSCTACHFSPNGGGALTNYGRVLSQEVLSTWANEGESQFLYGIIPPPSYLSFGGHLRLVQSYRNNIYTQAARLIWMQADLEPAILFDKRVIAVGTFGWDDTSASFVSRRHYLRFQPHLNRPMYLRVGRFYPAYGIHMPDHVPWIRSRMFWNQPLFEPYGAELSYLGDKYQGIITGFLKRPDNSPTDSGFSVSTQYIMNDSAKLGMSFAYTKNNGLTRILFGPNVTVGFTPRLFLLSELDFQQLSTAFNFIKPWSAYHYSRLDYEFIQGAHVYAVLELGKADMAIDILSQGFGLGAQFFPRPHFEFRAEYQRQSTSPALWSDVGWIMGYYYL